MPAQKLFCDDSKNSIAKTHDKLEKEGRLGNWRGATIYLSIMLVFSSFGGISHECIIFFKHLAEKLAKKRNIITSESIFFLRMKLRFSFVKSLV